MDHVEVLRLLVARRTEPLDVDALAAQARINAETARRVILDLETAGIVQRDGDRTRYAPSARDHDAVVEIVGMYNSRPVTLVRAIYARPSPVRSFADAFRIRHKD